MPFDPDKYLAEKQAATAQPSMEASTAFDPNAYLASKGINNLPNQGNIQNGPSTAESIGRAAAQGPTFGYGDEASAGTEAAMGAVDSLVNGSNSFGDQGRLGGITNAVSNYARARDTQRQQNNEAQQAHPVVSALVEMATSIPTAIAAGGPVALQGAIYGLGKSNKETALQSAKDAGWGALLAKVTQKGLQMGGSGLSKLAAGKEFTNLNTNLPAVDAINPENVGVSVAARPNGDFDIKFGGNLKDAVRLGADEGKLLTNKQLQANVTDEVNNVFGTEERPGQIPQLIDKTKASLGTIRDGVLKDKGAIATDVEGAFKKAYDKVDTYDTGGDIEKERAIADLKNRLQTAEFNLRSKSPTSSLDDVPLKTTFETKQDLGDKLFSTSQLYRKAQDARSIVQSLWGDLGKEVSTADKTGQVKTLTDGFAALYRMEDNAINSPKQIEALTNPNANAARNAYNDFVAPLKKLDPNTRAALMPELQEYIATQLPKTLNKAAVIKAVNNAGDSKGGIGWVLNKLYLNKSTGYQGAGAFGAASNMSVPARIPGTLGAIASSPVTQSLAPSIGALSTDNSQPSQTPALGQVK
jgi:hypothetical protein